MPRKEAWIIERELALRREPWTLRGPGRLVKVINGSESRLAASGYITTGIHLVGKMPASIRISLGLNLDDAGKGIRIYKLARLPQLDEYEYDLSAKFPGGLTYYPMSEKEAKYLPGDDSIPQWKIRDGAKIPVHPDFLELPSGVKLQYDWLLT